MIDRWNSILILGQTIPDVKEYITDPPIALLLIVLFVSIGAIVSGKLVVPRFVYDKEVELNKTLLKSMDEHTTLLKEYNDELRRIRRGQDE